MEQLRTTTILLYATILQDGNLARRCWVIFLFHMALTEILVDIQDTRLRKTLFMCLTT